MEPGNRRLKEVMNKLDQNSSKIDLTPYYISVNEDDYTPIEYPDSENEVNFCNR